MTNLNKNISPQELTARKIKSLMVILGIKQSDLAKEASVKRASISMVIAGKRKSTRLRRMIARAVGKDVTYYWPEYE